MLYLKLACRDRPLYCYDGLIAHTCLFINKSPDKHLDKRDQRSDSLYIVILIFGTVPCRTVLINLKNVPHNQNSALAGLRT